MTKPRIEIANWSKLQHFKDRDPIWIKLYRALRHNRRWRHLSGDAAKLYIDLLLLSTEDEPFGTINLEGDDLAWEVRLDLDNLTYRLAELSDSGLITGSGYRDDIKLITAGHQEDIPRALARGREEGEVEKEQTNGRDLKMILYIDPVEWSRFGKDFGISQDDLDATLAALQ
jgi:hypothetical protein